MPPFSLLLLLLRSPSATPSVRPSILSVVHHRPLFLMASQELPTIQDSTCWWRNIARQTAPANRLHLSVSYPSYPRPLLSILPYASIEPICSTNACELIHSCACLHVSCIIRSCLPPASLSACLSYRLMNDVFPSLTLPLSPSSSSSSDECLELGMEEEGVDDKNAE